MLRETAENQAILLTNINGRLFVIVKTYKVEIKNNEVYVFIK